MGSTVYSPDRWYGPIVILKGVNDKITIGGVAKAIPPGVYYNCPNFWDINLPLGDGKVLKSLWLAIYDLFTSPLSFDGVNHVVPSTASYSTKQGVSVNFTGNNTEKIDVGGTSETIREAMGWKWDRTGISYPPLTGNDVTFISPYSLGYSWSWPSRASQKVLNIEHEQYRGGSQVRRFGTIYKRKFIYSNVYAARTRRFRASEHEEYAKMANLVLHDVNFCFQHIWEGMSLGHPAVVVHEPGADLSDFSKVEIVRLIEDEQMRSFEEVAKLITGGAERYNIELDCEVTHYGEGDVFNSIKPVSRFNIWEH